MGPVWAPESIDVAEASLLLESSNKDTLLLLELPLGSIEVRWRRESPDGTDKKFPENLFAIPKMGKSKTLDW